MRLNKILMPTDFSSCADSALGEAILFARRFGAEMHVLHVIEWPPSPPSFQADLVAMEEVFERLSEIVAVETQQLLARLPTDDLEIRESQRRGISAAAEIVAYARAEEIDLVVLGTHGRRGFRHFLMGSIAEEVVQTAACPVLCVPQRGDLEVDLEIRRIVVPYDFSDDSQGALRSAILLARSFGCRIDLIHAVLPPVVAGPPVPIPVKVPATLTETLERSLREAAAAATTPEVEVDPHLIVGSATSSIVNYAEDVQANMIVMASHGLSGLHRFLVGSVTERVVRSASCPVLVCRNHLGPAQASSSDQQDVQP